LYSAFAGFYTDVKIKPREAEAGVLVAGHPARDVPPEQFAVAFRDWIAANRDRLAPLFVPHVGYGARVESARALRRLLFDEDWGRVGWPEEFGGLGGTIQHRAVLSEELYRAGWCGPANFEHVEIIAPTLVRFGTNDFVASELPRFLDGSRSWAQGFSEPEAGSDLASLRTRAVLDGDHLVINGGKIWTTWAKWSHWCLALVRTGTTEQRHRGLSMVAIDLTAAGVRVEPIRQANGTDELAQVLFEDVVVPANQLVGALGNGWRVALYLLAHERGLLSWLRHCGMQRRLISTLPDIPADYDRQVGDVALQIVGVRAAAAVLLRRAAAGAPLGPEAAFNKLLMTRAEQSLFNLLRDAKGPQVALPGDDPEDLLLQQEYLFSRIVTVYGGSQQMQLMTVARHILGLDDE
jgi:alkylation response protein AidB-like acyl-CoA dehydrogenase